MTTRKYVRHAAGLAMGLLMAVSAGTIASGQNGKKSVNQGVYTAAQAERGSKLFAGNCTTCHDTARFTGADFVKDWSGKSLHPLYDLMKTTMPEDNPGVLKPQQYADILAYFLELNDYPAGTDELSGSDEMMKTITMEALKKSGR